MNCGPGDAIYKVDGDPDVKWLVDGWASCHVVGFDPGSFLYNRKHVQIEIEVGGGTGSRALARVTLPYL